MPRYEVEMRFTQGWSGEVEADSPDEASAIVIQEKPTSSSQSIYVTEVEPSEKD